MAISSVRLARVSYQTVGGQVRSDLMNSQIKLFAQQSQLASGMRISRPSDDAALAGRATELMHLLDVHKQYAENAGYADEFLAATSDAFGDVTDALIQAHTLASANVGVTSDAAERRSAAVMIDGMLDDLLQVGNRQYRGEYLFGGTRTTEAPFRSEQFGVEFSGNSEPLTTYVVGDRAVRYNADGAQAFGAVSQPHPSRDLDPAMLPETRLKDLDGALGQGVRLGSLRISSGGVSTVVDLDAAETIGDVVTMINAATGGSVVASIGGGGRSINVSSPVGAEVVIDEVGGGTAARDLGVYRPTGGSSAVSGQDLGPRLVPTTQLSQLDGGSGLVLVDPLRITVGAQSVEVDLSSAATIEEVINLINATGLGVQARINSAGNGLEVINRASGAGMSIGEVGGGTTATQLGIRTMDRSTPLSMLNDGDGVGVVEGADLRIVATDGTAFEVDLSGAATLGEVIDRINAAASGAGTGVLARLAADGNGLELADGVGGPEALRVEALNGSTARADLGLDGPAVGGVLSGGDVNRQRPHGVFSYLMDLRDALRNNDTAGITRAGERINELLDQVNRTRGELAARSRAMSDQRMESEATGDALRATLSDTRDLDYSQAITRFMQLQTAMQANMQTAGRLLSMSLLDFVR